MSLSSVAAVRSLERVLLAAADAKSVFISGDSDMDSKTVLTHQNLSELCIVACPVGNTTSMANWPPFDVRFAAMRALQRIFQRFLSTQFELLDGDLKNDAKSGFRGFGADQSNYSLMCYGSQKRLKQRLSALRNDSEEKEGKGGEGQEKEAEKYARLIEVQLAYSEFVVGLLGVLVYDEGAAQQLDEAAEEESNSFSSALSVAALELLMQFAVLEHDLRFAFARRNGFGLKGKKVSSEKKEKRSSTAATAAITAAQSNDEIIGLVVQRLLLLGAPQVVLTLFHSKFVRADASIRCVALKHVKSALQQTKSSQATGKFAHRVIQTLAAVCSGVELDKAKIGDCKRADLLLAHGGVELDMKLFESCWLQALKLPHLSEASLLIALRHLPDNVLPHVHKPHILLDFLLAAFRQGGALAVLALRSLFVMIVRHNLDFPDFYDHVYAWLTHSGSELLQSLHAGDTRHDVTLSELLLLLEVFLSSTQLPRYLVAAFAKRLARLALGAPPVAAHGLAILCYGLLQQHASVRTLIHKPVAGAGGAGRPTLVLTLPASIAKEAESAPLSVGANGQERPERKRLADSHYCSALKIGSGAGDTFAMGVAAEKSTTSENTPIKRRRREQRESNTVQSAATSIAAAPQNFKQDPFVDDADDPSKANAAASSLWELRTLLSHYDSGVSRVARLMTESAFEAKIPVSSALSLTSATEAYVSAFSQLVAAELTRKGRNTAASTVPLAPEATHRLLGVSFGSAWHPFAA